jgi:8-oxo-dGTP pyrophosphatase MutT (NUDIX family)
MTDSAEKFATPRIAAGALFVEGSSVLLVRKTYGNRWDIPGGYVDRGESPARACQPEIREKLGLDRAPVRLLVHDWAPSEQEGDKILYVFSCSVLGDDETRIKLEESELDRWEWVPIDRVREYLIPRLARRVACAYKAHVEGTVMYLEHGVPVLPSATG